MALDPSQLLDRQVLDNPYPFYARLVAQAPVWRVGDSDVFAVASYAAVAEATRRTQDFSSQLRYFLYRDERGLPARETYNTGNAQVLATADPPAHGQHKKIINPYFTPSRLAVLQGRVAEAARTYLGPGLTDGRMEFMDGLANRLPIEVVTDLIAFTNHNTDALLRMAMVQTDMLSSAISKDELLDMLALSDNTYLWIVQQLQDAMEAPGDGILGALAMSVNSGDIDMVVAIVILSTLFAAGGESTSSLIGNSVHRLAADIPLQRKLRADISLLPRFIEEMLRLESPFRYHMRYALQSAELCGVAIPAGATLLMMWGAANRDPAAFENPDEIDLARPRRHVAFGHGIHACIGNMLARLEARIILEVLLSATREIAVQEHNVAVQVPSLAVRRFQRLPLLLQAA